MDLVPAHMPGTVIPFPPRAAEVKATTHKRTVHAGASIINYLEARPFRRDWRDRRPLQPNSAYARDTTIALGTLDSPPESYCTRLLNTCITKQGSSSAVNCLSFIPGQQVFIAGTRAGELLRFSAETFMQSRAIQGSNFAFRTMRWNHAGDWLVAGDVEGNVKVFTPSLGHFEDVKAHAEAIRGIDFCPTDEKMVTGGEDGSLKIWDFWTLYEPRRSLENELKGHGANVTSAAWHPCKSLIASSSKDASVKLWDPRVKGVDAVVASLESHKSWVQMVAWSGNGVWLASASRDQTIRVWDVRMMKEFQAMVSEHKGVSSLAWHPSNERLLTTGSTDGCLQHWVLGFDYPQAEIPHAHDSAIWDIAWHPLGHICVSGSHDHTSKVWGHARPGDTAVQYGYQGNKGNPRREYAPGNNPNVVPLPAGALSTAGPAEASRAALAVVPFASGQGAVFSLSGSGGGGAGAASGGGGSGGGGRGGSGGYAFDLAELEEEARRKTSSQSGEVLQPVLRDKFKNAALSAGSAAEAEAAKAQVKAAPAGAAAGPTPAAAAAVVPRGGATFGAPGSAGSSSGGGGGAAARPYPAAGGGGSAGGGWGAAAAAPAPAAAPRPASAPAPAAGGWGASAMAAAPAAAPPRPAAPAPAAGGWGAAPAAPAGPGVYPAPSAGAYPPGPPRPAAMPGYPAPGAPPTASYGAPGWPQPGQAPPHGGYGAPTGYPPQGQPQQYPPAAGYGGYPGAQPQPGGYPPTAAGGGWGAPPQPPGLPGQPPVKRGRFDGPPPPPGYGGGYR